MPSTMFSSCLRQNEITKYFTKTLFLACTLITVSQFNYGFDNQGLAQTLAMNSFDQQFGVYDPQIKAWIIEPYFLSLLNSLIYIGMAFGMFSIHALQNQ